MTNEAYARVKIDTLLAAQVWGPLDTNAAPFEVMPPENLWGQARIIVENISTPLILLQNGIAVGSTNFRERSQRTSRSKTSHYFWARVFSEKQAQHEDNCCQGARAISSKPINHPCHPEPFAALKGKLREGSAFLNFTRR